MKTFKKLVLSSVAVTLATLSFNVNALGYENCSTVKQFINFMDYSVTCKNIIETRKRNGQDVSSKAMMEYWQCASSFTNIRRVMTAYKQTPANIKQACEKLNRGRIKQLGKPFTDAQPVLMPYWRGTVK